MENNGGGVLEALVSGGRGGPLPGGVWVEECPGPGEPLPGTQGRPDRGDGRGSGPEWPPGITEEEIVAAVLDLLRALEPPDPPELEPWQLTDQALLADLSEVARHRARIESRWWALLAETERRETTIKETSLATASWLVHANSHSPRRARQEVALARSLDAYPTVARALRSGRMSSEQAAVICHGLDHLPDDLAACEREQITAHLVSLAADFGPPALRQLVTHAVEVVAPEVAEAADRTAVDRAERNAERSRYLSWHRDLDGGLLLHGKLTAADGDQFEAVIKAHAARTTTTDTLSETPTPWSAACADALATILGHYTNCSAAPRHGGDRPRIILTLDLADLISGLGAATLLGSGERISAATARRLACDADIIPAILDSDSHPLDLGRKRRLITGALRHALILRDRGCAFPGCDRQPADCDGHHIIPWWAGGHTKLSNAILLCQRHHKLVEPNPSTPPGSQWEARLDHHGLPEFLAPTRPGQPPDQRLVRQHHRYRLRRQERHNH